MTYQRSFIVLAGKTEFKFNKPTKTSIICFSMKAFNTVVNEKCCGYFSTLQGLQPKQLQDSKSFFTDKTFRRKTKD